MKIEKKLMKFEDGAEREMIIVDKEGYDLKEIKQADVGKTLPIAKKPTYFTIEQWEEIKKFKQQI